jgi:hypothetical protein
MMAKLEPKILGSFFSIHIKDGFLDILSTSNYYRGADLTTKGGVFCIKAYETVVKFKDSYSLFEYN